MVETNCITIAVFQKEILPMRNFKINCSFLFSFLSNFVTILKPEVGIRWNTSIDFIMEIASFLEKIEINA